jgi:GNAT superfamily N-acetyltransferase
VYTIKLVDPRKERALWSAIAAGQRECYARYGAAKASSDFDPFAGRVFAVAVVDGDGVPVAGARIHVRDNEHPLPIERHFAGNALLRNELAARAAQGVGEVGGLWAVKDLAGTGIGRSVVAATAAHAPMVGVRHLIAFVHQHHRFNDAVGFHLDERFGETPYPDARYRSVVRWCDTRALETAHRSVRLAILLQRRTVSRGERIRLNLPALVPSRQVAVGA